MQEKNAYSDNHKSPILDRLFICIFQLENHWMEFEKKKKKKKVNGMNHYFNGS
jgi:hypothetical protein